jgi:hypothetical protein
MRTTIVKAQLNEDQLCLLSRLVQRGEFPVDAVRKKIVWLGRLQSEDVRVGYDQCSDVDSKECFSNDNGSWYARSAQQLTFIDWRGAMGDQIIAEVGGGFMRASYWDALYLGRPEYESDLLRHFVAANGGVRRLEILSVRNARVGQFLRGEVAHLYPRRNPAIKPANIAASPATAG